MKTIASVILKRIKRRHFTLQKIDLEIVYGCVRENTDFGFPESNQDLFSLLKKTISIQDMILLIKTMIVTYYENYRLTDFYDRLGRILGAN